MCPVQICYCFQPLLVNVKLQFKSMLSPINSNSTVVVNCVYSEYFCRKHQTLLTATKHINFQASAPMWEISLSVKCNTPRQKANVQRADWSACGVAHLWVCVGSSGTDWQISEVPEGDTLPFSPHADRCWRQVSDSRLSLFDLPFQADRNPTNSTTHQLLHNSVLEAYLNTMTTLSACSLRKGCQSRFKEDLSSFKRLLLKPRTRRRAFRGGVWGFVAFLSILF